MPAWRHKQVDSKQTMHTFFVGDLHLSAGHRRYISYLQQLQSEGRAYDKTVVDGLIERFIEVANDNHHIKEICARRRGLAPSEFVSKSRLQAVIDASRAMGQAEGREECIEEIFVGAVPKEEKTALNRQLLQIKEEFSALSAHALSVLLIIAEIEDVLAEEPFSLENEKIRASAVQRRSAGNKTIDSPGSASDSVSKCSGSNE
ncbi:hypothetical protein NEHOM01_1114 [Nematocida homosporus]|uniref:uncharacterized protein n=1 Tax=Nematocida homosporus TaxID=1912981 RepID=UPI00221FCEAA|nr:uncharacterized protein NEHOM01_1114 [Nematocida homosporus]KAI5185864.1 hypothetical protein NEHOM01_1114 [Nematocida homosporus]